jgi:hypothetical protein
LKPGFAEGDFQINTTPQEFRPRLIACLQALADEDASGQMPELDPPILVAKELGCHVLLPLNSAQPNSLSELGMRLGSGHKKQPPEGTGSLEQGSSLETSRIANG